MSDSSAVDQAVVEKLRTDAALAALLPDGVFVDEAPGGSTRFVIVSLVEARDEAIFAGRGVEDSTYLVKAVALSTAGADIRAAAARIDALLELGTLTIPGYAFQVMRRRERVRQTEVDAVDRSIRWYHRGGRYQVVVAPLGT